MHPGDVLLVFSDGITEANDLEENEFGEDRLTRVVMNAPTVRPAT